MLFLIFLLIHFFFCTIFFLLRFLLILLFILFIILLLPTDYCLTPMSFPLYIIVSFFHIFHFNYLVQNFFLTERKK